MITKKLKSEIREHALEELPKECCGFIVKKNFDYLCVRAKNSSFNPDKFKIHPRDYLIASEIGKIQGVYHSHTSGDENFSEFDKFNSICHDVKYFLYRFEDNSLIVFDPRVSSFNKYVGRKFEIGKTDCYGLVRDFYKNELNIRLKNYHRDESWTNHLDHYFDKEYKNAGFLRVDDPLKYDCLLFKFKPSEPSKHIAIYLGAGLMLHQPLRSFSRIEEYTERHKKYTNYIIRHKRCKI